MPDEEGDGGGGKKDAGGGAGPIITAGEEEGKGAAAHEVVIEEIIPPPSSTDIEEGHEEGKHSSTPVPEVPTPPAITHPAASPVPTTTVASKKAATLTTPILESPKKRESWHRSRISELTEQQVQIFVNVWIQLRQKNVSLHAACAVGEDRECVLARFLRANQWNVNKTMQCLEDDVAWRQINDIPGLRAMRPTEILGCDLKELIQYYPHGHVGFDTHGRPIIVQRYGGFDVSSIKRVTTLEKVLSYHIWEQERNCALLANQSILLDRAIEGFCMIIDVSDMKMSKVTREFLWLVQRIAEIDQKHYPERLAVMYIINTPTVFPLVWKGIKPWLDVRTTNKIKIHAKPDQWKPALLENVDPSQLPVEYGGTAPPLVGREHSTEPVEIAPIIEGGLAVGPQPPRPSFYRRTSSFEPAQVPSSTRGSARFSLHHPHHHHHSRGSSSFVQGLPCGQQQQPPPVTSPPRSDLLNMDDIDDEAFQDALQIEFNLYEAEQANRMGLSLEEWTRLAADWRAGRIRTLDDPLQQMILRHRPDPTKEDTESPMFQMTSYASSGNLAAAANTGVTAGGERLQQEADIEAGGRITSSTVVGSNMEVQEGSTRYFLNLSDQIARMLDASPLLCSVCRRVLAWDVPRLQHSIEKYLSINLGFCFMMIAFGIYVLNNLYNMSDLLKGMIWLSVIIVCFGSLILLIAFLGYLGTKYTNRLLLNMYVICMSPLSLALFILAFVCFSAASPSTSTAYNKAWSRIQQALPESIHIGQFRRTVTSDALLLGAGCLVVSTMSVWPYTLSILLSIKLKQQPTPPYTEENHVRMVSRVSSLVTLGFGVVCILYGAVATHKAMDLVLAQTAFTPFLLLESGIVLLLDSLFGLWVAQCESPVIMAVYLVLVLPIFITLITLGGTSFADLPHVRDSVVRQYATKEYPGHSIDDATSWSKASLLIMGTLEVVVALFQLVNLVSIWTLRNACKDRWYRYRYRTFRPLRKREKLIIGWAIFSGLFAIFFNGTFVVFANWLSNPDLNPSVWYLNFFKWIGSADRRYLSSDPYIVTSGGILSVLMGPALLFFAYTYYMRRPYRFLLGIILCTVLVYSQLLYYATEMQTSFVNIDRSHKSAFWLYFIIGNLMKLIIPLVLLKYMLHESGRKFLRLKNFEILDVIQRLANAQAAGAGGQADEEVERGAQMMDETGPPLPLSVDQREGDKPNLLQLLHSRLAVVQEEPLIHHNLSWKEESTDPNKHKSL